LRLALELDELARRAAVDAQDRMRHEAQRKTLLGDFGKRRIEQERHIVVDHLDDGDPIRAISSDDEVAQADMRLAAGSRLGEDGERRGRDRLAVCRVETGEILGVGARKQDGLEAARQMHLRFPGRDDMGDGSFLFALQPIRHGICPPEASHDDAF